MSENLEIGLNVNTKTLESAISMMERYKTMKADLFGTGDDSPAGKMAEYMNGVHTTVGRIDAATRRASTAFDGWINRAKSLRSEIADITADIKGLDSASLDPKLKPSTRMQMITESGSLNARREELRKNLKQAESRAESLQSRYPTDMTPPGIPGTPAGGGSFLPGIGGIAKSAGMMALAWAGASSITGLLTSAKDRAKVYAERDLPLNLRGITINDETLRRMAEKFGVRPGQTQSTVDILNRMTGKTDVAGLMDNIAGRWLATGASPMELAQYIGGTYSGVRDGGNATGMRINKLLTQSMLLTGNPGRYSELYGGYQSLLNNTIQLRGGTPLDNTQAEKLAATMGLGWMTNDKTLHGASMANLMHQMGAGIAAGGSTPGAQMFLGQALGIEGVNSISGYWDFQKKMKSGANTDNIAAVIAYSRKMAGMRGLTGADADAFAMMNLRDSLGLTEYQAEAAYKKSGIFSNSIAQMNHATGAGADRIKAAIKNNVSGSLGFKAASVEGLDEVQQATGYGKALDKLAIELLKFKTGIGDAGTIDRKSQFKNMSDADVAAAAKRANPATSTTGSAEDYAIQQENSNRGWGLHLEGTRPLENALTDLTSEIKKSNRYRTK